MPRRTAIGDEWEDDPDDECDGDSDDDESETVPCPYCRRPIHEDAERCPYCEQYISAEETPLPKPAWIVIGAIIALLLVLIVWNKLR